MRRASAHQPGLCGVRGSLGAAAEPACRPGASRSTTSRLAAADRGGHSASASAAARKAAAPGALGAASRAPASRQPACSARCSGFACRCKTLPCCCRPGTMPGSSPSAAAAVWCSCGRSNPRRCRPGATCSCGCCRPVRAPHGRSVSCPPAARRCRPARPPAPDRRPSRTPRRSRPERGGGRRGAAPSTGRARRCRYAGRRRLRPGTGWRRPGCRHGPVRRRRSRPPRPAAPE